ncbi:MAG: ribonuclease HI [Pseudobdellovibrio sp.]
MNLNQVTIYCDGACSGNPGPGGYGSIVIYNGRVVELGDSHPATTNNRMEMAAVVAALNYCVKKLASEKIESIQVFTDSVYVIRGITQWIFGWKKRGWKNAANEEVSNQDIWVELDKTVQNVKTKLNCEIKWNFVKGHSGVAGNERCDEIGVAFSKDDYIDLYNGPAESYVFDVNDLPEIRPLPEMKSKSSSSGPKTVWYLSYINGVLTKHATWSECEAVVKGRAAKFKKVSNAEEEAAVKKSWGIS